MKHLNKTALLLAVSLTALLVAGCDTEYKNGGGFTQTSGDSPTVKTVRIDGCDYIAYQTAWGYWNYTLKGNGNCGTNSN